MKKIILFALLAFITCITHAQFTRYIVRFKYKGAASLSLSQARGYLSPRAIERRIRYQVAIDSTDLPVPAAHIAQVSNIPNVTVLNVSKWLNAVSIYTTDPNAINLINALPIVQSTSPLAARSSGTSAGKYPTEILPLSMARGAETTGNTVLDYGNPSFNEIHIHEGEFLHNIGLQGQGIQIAMLDGGFFQYTNFDAFDSANANGQFLDTWDFVDLEPSVVEDESHGMSCLSTIAANIPGQFIGTAPKAAFRLYRTEDGAGEYPIEEFNWVCGAERADSAGADVISSSLGYSDFDNSSFNHTYSDLNGDLLISTIAADLAAKKGLLVFISAGNEGNSLWHYITSPADGDSVITVGAVNVMGAVGSFSSYGPSADGRVKPDVASVGVTAMIQTSGNTIGFSNGTSFACPKMAGLGSALWQGFPEVNNMRIVQALKEAGSIYAAPNNRIGYGIPNMKTAFAALLKEFATVSVSGNDCDITLNWTSKDVAAMRYEIERKAPGDPDYIKIATIDPQPGTILSAHDYTFVNTSGNISPGTISYRVRQIIDTAAASFTALYIGSGDATITAACDGLYIAPNPPTGDNAILVVQTSYAIASMPVAVYDMKGSLVMQFKQSKLAGRSTFSIPTGRLAKGKYIVKVYDGDKTLGTTQFVKL